MKKQIFFASTNGRKISSYSKRLKQIGWELLPVTIDIPESRDFSTDDVAKKKLQLAMQQIPNRPLFVEDRGLEIDCLNSFPGSHIKIVTNLLGIPKLMEILDKSNSRVTFRYSIAFVGINNEIITFSGSEIGHLDTHTDLPTPQNLFDVFFSDIYPKKPISMLSDHEAQKYENYWTKTDAMHELLKYLNTNK